MGPYGVIWKTVACVSVVLLLGMAFHQAAKSTSGRKALHGGMSLPYSEFDKGESGDRWTAERLCRHFKAGTRRAQVQLPDPTRELGRTRRVGGQTVRVVCLARSPLCDVESRDDPPT